ncbi:Site-specific recombinase, DNA invertase Pin-like protein [Halanaeroarchaeum sp. HSR-CO]|uniref:recombinase family protein n=1 Tax=Halanaeroarchaeum sp. HSR-CO TaxID=2866382 RepID=UPI00217E21EC|nr:recombinase family protein [Halanaeroarchaeum sp. HSR-CO]UWG47440.1 Site-specific recombinase, DNA invertase Pin-like protein [Halanaeroarchaeum sp. HSR-CO]
MSKEARGYVRLSQKSESSIRNQIDDIENYCEQHVDLELDYIYNEGQNASGWDASRKWYQQMLDDAKAGKFDVLVVAHGSRLGRDKLERLDRFTDLANKWGVEFHTVKRGYVDPNLPQDILMEVFHSLSDDEGKGAEVERLTKAIEKKVENGDYHGAPKFGTKYSEDKTSLVRESEFETAIEVLHLRETGKTYREIESETGCNLALIKRILDNENVYRTIEARDSWRPKDSTAT